MRIVLDPTSDRPLAAQIARQIHLRIASGRLAPGARIPPARDLARDLDVNFHTVRAAYAALAARGLVVTRRRTGTRVAADAPTPLTDGVWRWRRVRELVGELASELMDSRVDPETCAEVVADELRRTLRSRIALETLRRAQAGRRRADAAAAAQRAKVQTSPSARSWASVSKAAASRGAATRTASAVTA